MNFLDLYMNIFLALLGVSVWIYIYIFLFLPKGNVFFVLRPNGPSLNHKYAQHFHLGNLSKCRLQNSPYFCVFK